MSVDDDMRDKHGLPPRHRKAEPEHPVNLAPIRAVVGAWESQRKYGTAGAAAIDLAEFATHAIPTLCDEIVRLRAALADQQVTPA